MRNKNNYTQEESTLLQEIVRAYRYPDGTLNGIAVFISTLALVLLLILGHFTINAIKHVTGLTKVSASELDLKGVEEYVTETYLDAIDDYTNGKIDHETAKARILKQLAAYVNSSSALTYEQKDEIIRSMEDYLKTINLDEYMATNNTNVNEIKASLEKYVKENEETIKVIKTTIREDIEGNKELTDEEIEKLNELYEKIKKLEASDINQVNSEINNMHDELTENITNNYNSFIFKLYDGIDEWNAADTYMPNSYVMYKNVLYKNLTGNNTAKTPDVDKDNWQEASITSVINNNYHSFINTVGTNDYNASGKYQVGDCVIYNNRIYKNITGGNGTPGKSDDWETFSLTSYIDDIEKRLTDIENRTSTVNEQGESIKFDFVYERGTYGYRLPDGTFKPF
jgi:hypothetical protein